MTSGKDTGTVGMSVFNGNQMGELQALRQVAKLCQKSLSLDVVHSADGTSFHSKEDDKPRSGVLSFSGKLSDDAVIAIRMELLRGPRNLLIDAGVLFKGLAGLDGRVRVLKPEEEDGKASLQVELDAKASPMSITRASAFSDQIKQLDTLARSLQAELPALRIPSDLIKAYEAFDETLAPVHPLDKDGGPSFDQLLSWAEEAKDFLTGSASLGIASPFLAVLNLALAAVASACLTSGTSLGHLIPPAIGSKGLLDLAAKAPGMVVVPAVRLRLGTNPYELGNEMHNLLAALSASNKPVIFTGTLEELQAVFSGGQGAKNDPLFPVVRHAPDVPLDDLVQFAVALNARLPGGLSQNTREELIQETLGALQDLSLSEQKRVLPVVVSRAVNVIRSGAQQSVPLSSFASKVSALSETLGGLSPRPRVRRVAHIQERFVRVLSDTGLLDYFREHLLAQDGALEHLVKRLSMEALTRPIHQPIRYCAQGTPGTGKSESAILLARKLDIPYVNIDAASMPDYHTAASQLLGSGRGIVMSHQAGRLEQTAKHHQGAVMEVSDIDHAHPSVRAYLGDLFTQPLETGEAQSATGAMFSCANVIFIFTMNLPGGMDEAVRKGIGFHNLPSDKEVRKRVTAEIKRMLSGAFLSRIGTPILFDPLDGDALAAIVERAIRKAILSATEHLDLPIQEVVLEEGLGATVLASVEPSITSFGARALLEHARALAAEAIVEVRQKMAKRGNKALRVSTTSQGGLRINPI
ncbi:MAG: AAA family ATPase [Thermodesulfobacteriota bacterium]|nr:AAA family ATPase [Thermodesulfobacteriota bacterium]